MMARYTYWFAVLTVVAMVPVVMWVIALTDVRRKVSVKRGMFSLEELNTTPGPSAVRVGSNDRDVTRDTFFIDDSVAKETLSKIKVFCWITTQEKELNKKIPAVNETWARRCDNKMFVMTTTKQYPGKQIINLNISDGRQHLTEKTIAALQYIYDHHLDKYDWFLKADDDTYIIMENLKYLLSHYNPKEGVYIGHLFKKYSVWGYMSGGAGYVVSQQAIKQLVEQGYRKNSTCKKTGADEDVELGACLHKVGIPVHNSLDKFGRETFHPFSADQHLSGTYPKLLPEWDRHPTKQGEECCSQLTISFHYLSPSLMRTVDFLLYRTTVYGRMTEPNRFSHFFQIGVVPSLPTSSKLGKS